MRVQRIPISFAQNPKVSDTIQRVYNLSGTVSLNGNITAEITAGADYVRCPTLSKIPTGRSGEDRKPVLPHLTVIESYLQFFIYQTLKIKYVPIIRRNQKF